jgi:hypothetical protein
MNEDDKCPRCESGTLHYRMMNITDLDIKTGGSTRRKVKMLVCDWCSSQFGDDEPRNKYQPAPTQARL